VVHTERGFDRIVNFSDATVAIAMTLLVLPLVDLGGHTGEHQSLWQLLTDNSYELFAFVLSFLVIWSMWTNHHRIMEFFADYDSRILGLHLVWLLTMVSIPFTTELLANPDYYEHGATALYVAVLLVNSVSLHLIGLQGRQHPELLHDRPEVTGLARGAVHVDDGPGPRGHPRRRAGLPWSRSLADAAALRRRPRREPHRPTAQGPRPHDRRLSTGQVERIAAISR
jgi:uncharacterized membrane protein